MNTTTPPAALPPAAQAPVALRFGPFVLDQHGGRLLRDGQVLELAPRPWALLCFLAQRPGQLVGKDELLDSVWGHRFVSESALKVTVNSLRQVLGEDAREAVWVQTVPRRGYRFSHAVEPLAPGAPAAPLLASPQPPAPPMPVRPLGNLPTSGGPLLGREPALAALAAELAVHRLITLTGPGGAGKTRLALAAASQAVPAGGVWLVRLDDLDQASGVGRAVARTLGLGDAAGASAQALGQALAFMQLRLLLDNAEHLADGLAPQLALWLQQAPGLSVLVTSQRPLQLGDERVWPVPPLPLPVLTADTHALRDNPAVALMVHRAQALRPDWQPAQADLVELAAIARALDGLPLALELAAARVPLLGAAGVHQRLGARLQMLTGGRADAPTRQRTLRASLEWSFGLLPPLAARALTRLSCFAGGFTADAAQAVLAPALPGADEWAVLDVLALLQDLALLAAPAAATTATAPTTGLPATAPRLRLLDSVRLFGLERLAEADDLLAAQADHRAWMLTRFVAAEDAYFEMGTERWLAPLEGEAENLIAAMERGLSTLESASLTDGPAAAQALAATLVSLVAASTNFCLRAGLGQRLSAWRGRLSACLGPQPWPQHTLPTLLQGRWCLAGAMMGGLGLLNTSDALALGEQAVSRLGGSPRRQLMALYVSGLFQLRLGRSDALATTLAHMQQLSPTAEAPPYVRHLRPMLVASAAQRHGDLAAYAAYYADALAEYRALGDRFESWRAAWGLGQARFLQGELDDAVAIMDQAMAEVRAAGRLHAQSGFAGQAVFVRLARDASPETLARLHEVLPVLQSQQLVFAAVGDALAWVPLWQGRLADALRVQGWADARTATEKSPRSHVAQRLRDQFAVQTGQATPPDAPPLDEAGALRLVLQGVRPGAALPIASAQR